MHGATGNIYCGLHEFAEMAFALHFLRPSDLFIDIGANVGTYTILASGVVKARSLAIEPIASSSETLRRNIRLNRLDHLVELLDCAVGQTAGNAFVTDTLGCTNHVISEDESIHCESVKMIALDDLLLDQPPSLIKIDVEGFELPILKGGKKMLSCPSLKGLIVEMNESGKRYGFTDNAVAETLLEFGFNPFIYSPKDRSLSGLDLSQREAGNVLWLRDSPDLRLRISNASSFSALGESF